MWGSHGESVEEHLVLLRMPLAEKLQAFGSVLSAKQRLGGGCLISHSQVWKATRVGGSGLGPGEAI